MPKAPQKRSLTIAGHRTSISLDQPFWDALKDIAAEEGTSISVLVGEIDRQRGVMGLSAATRIHILAYYKSRAETAASK